ncbi:hypothetical protein NEMIN01_1516 [Nematocida minor]|uniref:uncharacterized protein n=1 Tax=Nematocida minor TaxID=1912983 RepID=UPI002220D044|nr:uncharacterized protein NEMIN01_1516 [Nematocida minor]KAI5191440.1 hypothetical protein NEMIN01_1516 [Nematocida minor]
MDEEYFSTCVSSCADAHWASKKGKVLMRDCEFGTTCMSDEVYTNKKMLGALIHVLPSKSLPLFPIEMRPALLRPVGSVTCALIDTGRFDTVPFIRVSTLYYVGEDNKRVKVPNTREELAFCRDIPAEDKLVMYKMGMESFEDNFLCLSHKTREILLGVFEETVGVKEYLMLFGRNQYLFPACSFSELSRAIIHMNSNIQVKITNDRIDNKAYTSPESDSAVSKDVNPSSSTDDGSEDLDTSSTNGIKNGKNQTPESDSDYDQESRDSSSDAAFSTSPAPSTNKNEYHYYYTLILNFPVAEVPSKFSYKAKDTLIHFLHIKLYGLMYAYIWSDKTLPPDTLRRIGISHGNILFHCEFRIRKY